MKHRTLILLAIVALLLIRASLSGVTPVERKSDAVDVSRQVLTEALIERGLSPKEAQDLVDALSDEEALELAADQGLIDSAGMRSKFVVTFVIIGLMLATAAITLAVAEDTDTE